ncbi:MAG: hypothetical protein VX593_06170 [Pseudomonadota bacterium]|nr:hypothetical protein [Pseudomonadota bacterium]
MTAAPLNHDEAWLLEQVSMMRDWYDAMSNRESTDSGLADAIARHLAWLESNVRELTHSAMS